jgi:hypothetical protein
MGESETFGIESGFAKQAIEWMNSQAAKHKWKFEARSYNHTVTTKNFGSFEMFSWIGDIKVARSIIVRVSKRFKARVIEGGYKPKDKIYKKNKSDYAMVRKGERVIGHIEFTASRLGNNMWDVEAEERK